MSHITTYTVLSIVHQKHGHKGLANKLNYFAFRPLLNYLHPPVLYPWVGLSLMFRKYVYF